MGKRLTLYHQIFVLIFPCGKHAFIPASRGDWLLISISVFPNGILPLALQVNCCYMSLFAVHVRSVPFPKVASFLPSTLGNT